MRKLVLIILVLSFSLYASDSSAQMFRLRITDWGGVSNTDFQNFVNTELQKIETEMNDNLPSAPPKRLMEGMANSSIMAGKGIGSDYASNMSVFLIGAGAGVGADLHKDKQTGSDISGVGVAPGLIIGANLGFLDTATILGMDTNRLNVYMNFMNHSRRQNISQEAGKESSAELDMTTMGIHFRYDWIEGAGNKLLGWGGVKVHFGYEYNKSNITFNSKINETFNETGPGGEDINGTISGSPKANILVSTHSIPLELSTDVQLLYILSLYGGVGADYNFGRAVGSGSLNGGQGTLSCTGGLACGSDPDIEVQPEANIDATGKVSPFTFRSFAGVQINLPFVRIFGQVDKALGNDLIGATAGVRFVY